MNLHVHHHLGEFGLVSTRNPLLWIATAALGFVLLEHWPVWSAGPMPAAAQAQPALSVGATAPAYVSSDPSLPPASDVFAGRPYEPAQYIDQF